jgi:hypothetical protein
LLALFSLLDIAGSLAMILFWTIAGSLFDPREARRLFGLISAGAPSRTSRSACSSARSLGAQHPRT